MSEWDRIVKEREEEHLYFQNTKIINRMLEGKRIPPREEIVKKLTERYSKYGKEQRHR